MKAVNTRVSNIVVERDGYNIKASWVVPDEMIDKDNERCAQWVDSRFEFWTKGKSAAQHVEAKNSVQKGVGNPNPGALDISFTNADYFWVRGQGTGDKVTKNFDRRRYYPFTSNKCEKVRVAAWGGNPKGVGVKLWTQYTFGLPRSPKVSWEWDSGNVTLKVETDAGEDTHERYDTMIRVTFKTADGTTFGAFPGFTNGWFSTQSTKYEHTFDLGPYIDNLISGKLVSIKGEAYARGMLGDSTTATYQCNVIMPIAATIGEVTVDKKAATGRIKVAVKPGGWTTTVQLQRRHGESGSWEDVSGAVDNEQCAALYDSYGGAAPVDGEYIYYRVKSWRAYGDYTVYSAAKRADCLFTEKVPPACNATVGLPALRPGDDGASFEAVMAWTDSTANEGCELSYSTDVNAWDSSEGPTTVEYTSADAQKDASAEGFAYSRTVTASGLDANETYYVDMRRYRTVDGEKCYSKYAGRATVTMESAANDKCGFVSIEPQGTSATLLIGINETGTNAGTEVTWSDYEGAWESNEQPNKLEATWDTAGASGDWGKTQTVRLRGLEPGRTYHVRARRYDANGTYGAYGVGSFRTGTSSASLDLRCGIMSIEGGEDGRSAIVVVGWSGDRDGCEVSWSTDPNAWESNEQPSSGEFEWEDAENQGFAYVLTTDTAPVEGKTYYQLGPTVPPAHIYYIPVENPSAEEMQRYYEKVQLWSHTGTYYLRGLDEGQTYYVKARTYAEPSSGKAYSDYSEAVTVTPYSAPESVSLTAPEAVARGQAIELWWTVQSDMEQTEWRVHEAGLFGGALAIGSGTLSRASVPAERYRDLDEITMYVDASCGGGFTSSNEVTVAIVQPPECHASISPVLTSQPASFEVYADRTDVSVLATCRSEGITVTLPDRDVEQVAGDVVWTAASAPEFEETTWGETAYRQRLAAAVTAAQADVDSIEAEIAEMDDDDPQLAIAQNSLAAANSRLASAQAAKQADLDEHPSDGTVYEATVELPVTDFYDGGNYSISVHAAESVAGLASETVELPFSVNYAHKAATPPAEITVVPDVETRSARVTLAAVEYEYVLTEDTSVDPSKTYYSLAPWIEGYDGPEYVEVENPQDELISGYFERVQDRDVYDVYRKTQDGYDLISSNNPLEGNVLDNFAPFGNVELAYRVSYRTKDGSIAFRDYPYEMDVRGMRFDWDNRSVELPWNVEAMDAYSKSFEARSHADGSVNGYYDKAVTRTGTLSTDTMKIKEQGTLELVRALGNYAGACFCRTDKGAAFQCDAELSEVSASYNAGAVPVRFELTRMDLSQEFMVKDEEDVDNG